MIFEDFCAHLLESQSEDNGLSLSSWATLQAFRDSNLPLCVQYVTQIISNGESEEQLKCIAMILLRKIISVNPNQVRQALPQDIYDAFFQSLLDLFEYDSLQVVSIASSILFYFSAEQIRNEDPNFILISTFADNLRESTNPFSVFGFSCLLFELCQTFPLPNEVNFSVVSALFQQLNTGNIPPVVANRLIALFRSTIPNYSQEFIASEFFQDCLRMLVGLSNNSETKTESYIAWSIIMTSCPQFSNEVLDSIGELTLDDMQNSTDIATLIAACIFWGDTITNFASNTQPLIAYTEPLLIALFRLLTVRGSDQIHEEFDQLPQAARHTLKTLLRYTPGTSASIVSEIVEDNFSRGVDTLNALEVNALLIFFSVIATSTCFSFVDVENCSTLLQSCLSSDSQLLILNSLRLLKRLLLAAGDRSVFSESVQLVLELNERDIDTSCRAQLAKVIGRSAQCPEFSDVRSECVTTVLQLSHSSDCIVSASAFQALSEIALIDFDTAEEYVQNYLQMHQQIVQELLNFLDETVSQLNESPANQQFQVTPPSTSNQETPSLIQSSCSSSCVSLGSQFSKTASVNSFQEMQQNCAIINDICQTLTPFITTMDVFFEDFAEEAITLLMSVAPISRYSYLPISYIAGKFTDLFGDYLEPFVEILLDSMQSGDDERTASSIQVIYNIAECFDISDALPSIVEIVLTFLMDCDRHYIVLQASAELIVRLKKGGIDITLSHFSQTIPKLTDAFEIAYQENGDFGMVAASFLIYASMIIEDTEDEGEKGSAIEMCCELAEKTCSVCSRIDTDFISAILIFVRTVLAIDVTVAQQLVEQNPSISEMIKNAASFPNQLHELLSQLTELQQAEPTQETDAES